jgi:hypothetical protein
LSYLVGIKGKRRNSRPPYQNSLLSPFSSTTATNTNPQWVITAPADPLARPHLAVIRPRHLTPTQDAAATAMGAQLGQHSTDHPLRYHLTTSLALDPKINSTS